MTGYHTGHSRVRKWYCSLFPEDLCVAEIMKAAGTWLFLQMGLSEPGTTECLNQKGFDEYYMNQVHAS